MVASGKGIRYCQQVSHRDNACYIIPYMIGKVINMSLYRTALAEQPVHILHTSRNVLVLVVDDIISVSHCKEKYKHYITLRAYIMDITHKAVCVHALNGCYISYLRALH